MTENNDFIGLMVEAIKHYQPLPPMPEGLTIEQAYLMQHQLSYKMNDAEPTGIKAGITHCAAQAHFGLSEAVIGSLYNSGRLSSECSISAIPGLLFECEIGVIIDEDGKPKSVLPVVEIVYLAYSSPSDLSGANIIAANVGADRVICGDARPWENQFEGTKISIAKNGDVIGESTIQESLGGVESGTAWMLAQATKRHFNFEDGTLLILGTCGSVTAAEVGTYTVDFGDLGAVVFTVR